MKKEIKLDDVIEDAKALDSFLITITTKDKNKEEGDLTHYLFRKEFHEDDIIPSLDASVRLLGVKSEQPIEVLKAPVIIEERKPLKIAILTHFNRCPDSYSPGKAVKNQIKLLQQYGHEVVFFTQEGSKLDVGCEMRPVVPKFKRVKWEINEDAKKKFIDVLREQLANDFDIAITHDFYIDDCITYREAIRECGVKIEWLHWARSGVGRPINFKMDNARYVYMNNADAGIFARKIGVLPEDVRIVYNEKDPSLFFGWNPLTKIISDKMKLYNKDIIQTYPMCTTRMDAKGINSVIKVLAEIKKQGKEVALIICNSNGRRRVSEIENKMKFAKDLGLTDADILFTSTLAEELPETTNEVPNIVVAQLMQISNLFIFPTIAEVCSNVLLEASMAKNLLVLNKDLPSLFDFAGNSSVLSHPFTSSRNLHFSDRDNESISTLAKQIIGQIESNKADQQMRHVWKIHSGQNIYQMLKNIIYERIK